MDPVCLNIDILQKRKYRHNRQMGNDLFDDVGEVHGPAQPRPAIQVKCALECRHPSW